MWKIEDRNDLFSIIYISTTILYFLSSIVVFYVAIHKELLLAFAESSD